MEEYYKQFYKKNEEGFCDTCKTPTEFKSISKGYKKYCSHTCAVTNKRVRALAKRNYKNSLLEKYGVENISQLPETVEKVKQTKKKRYGSENYNNSEQYRKTCLEKYGVDNPSKNADIQEKRAITNLERYGSVMPLNNPKVHKKARETSKDRYGHE